MNLKSYFDAAQAADAAKTALANTINAHFEAGETAKAMELRPQLDHLKDEAKKANDLYLSMRDAVGEGEGDPARRFIPLGGGEPNREKTRQVENLRASPVYRDAFFAALRSGVTPASIQAGHHASEKFGILLDAVTETGGSPTGSEGGFLAPIDYDGVARELTRQLVNLADYFGVETVNTLSGWRTVETAKASAALTKHTEADPEDSEISDSPTWKKIDFTLDEYFGYLPISNSALQDVPANLMNYIARFFGRKEVLTNNSLILALINAISASTVSDPADLLTAIKTALNVTLDPGIAAMASIFCNQTGFDLLDKLEDEVGRPLLQPDPSNATQMRVKGRQVILLADGLWPNLATPTRARFAIGFGPDYCTLFKRGSMEFASTLYGGEAWRSNTTEVRGIARLDCQEVDTGALVLLKVNAVAAGSGS